MSKKKVREFTCDTCGVPAITESKTQMPKGWIHVAATNYRGDVFLNRDLCPEHAQYLITVSKQIRYENAEVPV